MKINIDREPLSDDYIESKKDFKHVLESVKATKVSIWKSKWFYGAIGVASISGVILLTSFNDKENDQNLDESTEFVSHLTTTTVSKEEVPVDEYTSKLTDNVEKKIVSDEIKQSDKSVAFLEETENMEEESEKDVIAQEEFHEEIQEESENTNLLNYPSINGVYTGNLSHTDLEKGVFINKGVEVIHYNLRYPFGSDYKEVRIHGAKIPNEIQEEMANINSSTIFITDILVRDGDGANFYAPSMNFSLIKK